MTLPPAAPLLDLPRPWLGVGLRQWDPGVDLEWWRAAIAAALDRFLESHGGSAVQVPCHRAVRWSQTDDTGAGEAVREHMARGAIASMRWTSICLGPSEPPCLRAAIWC